MFDGIYLVYNEISRRYVSALSFPSDGMAVYRLTQDLPKIYQQPIDTFRVYKVGNYDLEDLNVTLLEKYKELDLNQTFSHDKLEAEMVDK